MDAFTVLQKRGQVFSNDTLGSDHSPNPDYNEASGPSPRGADRLASPRAYRMPFDLARSRRVGLRRTACAHCDATMDQGFCKHEPDCQTRGRGVFIHVATGPLKLNETSADTGWW